MDQIYPDDKEKSVVTIIHVELSEFDLYINKYVSVLERRGCLISIQDTDIVEQDIKDLLLYLVNETLTYIGMSLSAIEPDGIAHYTDRITRTTMESMELFLDHLPYYDTLHHVTEVSMYNQLYEYLYRFTIELLEQVVKLSDRRHGILYLLNCPFSNGYHGYIALEVFDGCM